MKSLFIALLPIALFGGIIESPPVCDTPKVVQELKDIVKHETGKTVKDLIVVTKGSSIETNGDHICGCSLSIDGTDYYQYAYGLFTLNNSFNVLDKHTKAKYESLSPKEREKFIRVEFLKEIQTKDRKNPVTINPSYK